MHMCMHMCVCVHVHTRACTCSELNSAIYLFYVILLGPKACSCIY